MALTLKAKYSDILLRPRITEKASFLAQSNVYTFEVASSATKKQVAEAIKVFYEVTPIRVNIVKNPAKKIFVRGKKGITAGVKKAYVYRKRETKLNNSIRKSCESYEMITKIN